MRQTLQVQYENALLKRGCSVIERKRQHVKMTMEDVTLGYYWLGPSGAVRYGKTKTMSLPRGDIWKSKLLSGDLP